MTVEHLYVITYDIANPKRWRHIFRIMNGFGSWLQLSVFQCRLTRMRLVELEAALNDAIKHDEDHVLLLDLGPAENVTPRVRSLGKSFLAVEREAVIV